ncbi:MAG: hypothetical protein M1831_004226 [Alyxoria varia]|nr:MAG: hypothetical protein M1831_004226 [Alyxoria varia]
MVDVQPPSRSGTPSSIPLKRSLEEDHTPTVSSPLNPDAPARGVRGNAREQREKKDSLKKREAAGIGKKTASESSPSSNKKRKTGEKKPIALSPIRYNHPLPKDAYHYTDKDPLMASHEPEPFFAPGGVELKRPLDHTENKKAYSYRHCIADPSFIHSRYYRNSDDRPYGPRMSFADSDKWFHFDNSGRVVTNEKGWRMGRANIVAREGSFYYEVKILKGVPANNAGSKRNSFDNNNNNNNNGANGKESAHNSEANANGGPPTSPSPPTNGPTPHIRMGWARREASLDTPIGFDGYSYGLTDSRLEPMHKSRATRFLDNGTDNPPAPAKKGAKSKAAKAKQAAAAANAAANGGAGAGSFAAMDSAREGDVIGLSITLPSLRLHHKVAAGDYNPAADFGAGAESLGYDEGDGSGALNIVRDRFPVPYKGAMYFESTQYAASKGMEGYGDRGPFAKETPSTNHGDPTLRSLPGSSIKVWKNGKMLGTAFKGLMAFLPPCSVPAGEKGVRPGLDDGAVGYYPAISAFCGAVAEVNFGPDFWCPPPEVAAAVKRRRSSGEDGGAVGGVDGGKHREENGEATSTNDPAQGAAEAQDSGVKKEDTAPNDADTLMADAPTAGATTNSTTAKIRPISERYTEQIAEDIVYDLIDEADFYVQDSGGD